MSLKAPKPKSPKYPKILNSLGNHIRKRRLDLGLLQKQVAEQIGAGEPTIYNWENDRTAPPDCFIRRIIQFLGHNPI
ncbi:MAG: helix-turn-helix transcriptional regulator [Candidatus Hydrothermarchaeales archaeon]